MTLRLRTNKGAHVTPIHHPVSSPIVINWHVTEACNFQCRYCYAKWQQPDSHEVIRDPGATTRLLEALYAGFNSHGNSTRPRLNFAGGEPLLFGGRVAAAMELSRSMGFDVSLITNGSRLTANLAERTAPLLSMLGISIDATSSAANSQIGRLDGRGKHLDVASLIDQIVTMRRINPRMVLKINTVVNEGNWQENLTSLISTLAPSRWKVLRMLPAVTNDLAVSDAQFQSFVERHSALSNIMCVEDNDDMVQSYIMVDPHGRFFQNRTGQTGYDYSASIIDVGALAAFESMKWSAQKFSARYPRIDIKAVA
jgi:radical S-adenosyl methionine domain-containing protein 2